VTAPVLYDAALAHDRRHNIRRRFSYGTYMWLIDLDRLPRLPRWARPLARFEARDHLGDPRLSIKDNVTEWLAGQGVDLDGGRILMLTNARVLGYAFNPLTLFWCKRRDGSLACVIAEVHNTYGGRHPYLLPAEDIDERGVVDTAKVFHVSPFLADHGTYRMVVPEPGERLRIAVTLHQGGKKVFGATVTGERRPATLGRVLRMSLRRPLMPQWVSTLIRRQGIVLWLRKQTVPATAPLDA
jgi:DUF1365 family protein